MKRAAASTINTEGGESTISYATTRHDEVHLCAGVQTRRAKIMASIGLQQQNLKQQNAAVPVRKQLNRIPLRSMIQKENTEEQINPSRNENSLLGFCKPTKRPALTNLINQSSQPTTQSSISIARNTNTIKAFNNKNTVKVISNTFRRNQVQSSKYLKSTKSCLKKIVEEELPEESSTFVERENSFPVPHADDLEEFSFPDLAFTIYEGLRRDEQKCVLYKGYLYEKGRSFNAKIRTRIIDWLIQTHAEFHLTSETLHSAVKIFDRYAQKETVSDSLVHLYALAALFVASKLEETFIPTLDDFIVSTEGLFRKVDIISMELNMCRKLGYDLCCPTSLQFLRRFSKIGMMTSKTHCFAKFLLELAFFNRTMVHWLPSYTAACALYTVRFIYEKPDTWNKCLAFHSTYNEESVSKGARRFAKMCINHDRKAYKSVFDKYSAQRLLSISQCTQEESIRSRLLELVSLKAVS
ncbi:hypothetical protein GJ496_003663 [Pomphorhynchus laevis]|nr:hypothetical protein GJ496_003663 [Pomphorhynchus laevis]